MIKELIKIANELDSRGLGKEADYLDGLMRKIGRNPAWHLSPNKSVIRNMVRIFPNTWGKHYDKQGNPISEGAKSDTGDEFVSDLLALSVEEDIKEVESIGLAEEVAPE